MSEHQGSPIMFTSRVGAVCVCLACVAANPASASEFYSYTGNNYELIFGTGHDTSMRVTATLEFASLLPPNLVDADVIPISFHFNDGVNTITENSDIDQQTFRFSTDEFGNVTFWNVSAKTALPSPSNEGDQRWEIATMNTTSGTQVDLGDISTRELPGVIRRESGQIWGNPGTWTVVQAPLATLAAASLPTSRSVQVPTPATAFGTIINSGIADATGCGIAPGTPAVAADFSYQTTDPVTNAPTGTPDTPADIAAGGSQSYVFSFTPSADIPSTGVALAFDCTDTDPAAVIPGVNTFLLSASTNPVSDIVALAATQSGDGIVRLPGDTGSNAFAVASVNVGSTDTITASADTGTATLPVALSLCESIPATGECLSPPATSVTTAINAGATPTFSIFVTNAGTVPFDPANNRINVVFRDAGGVVRGSTSVAVRTQ